MKRFWIALGLALAVAPFGCRRNEPVPCYPVYPCQPYAQQQPYVQSAPCGPCAPATNVPSLPPR